MNYDEIKKLIEDMGNSRLDSLDIEFPDGVKIRMTKNTQKNIEDSKTISENVITKVNVNTVNSEDIKNEEMEYKVIKSPMVGTFYESSSPTAEPFVSVGDKVKKGQVICIVEAMKLMNEIESEFDGEIVEICVKNEDMVEYGMPLFKIK